ncbi:Dihydroorotate dehydrogenase-domain-containing protein [Crepidotus variabilis]|uniref:Dihydroorotate dehydrogenase (quinone), mitochondrial n=1 Tax=Crepidotus variabilis TaxID=179855 RepID=A0A9P6EA83_9AGAR|nr:Dihydroorotate dehydrogenase-domain-containing protein [Crepidotus variabilis]
MLILRPGISRNGGITRTLFSRPLNSHSFPKPRFSSSTSQRTSGSGGSLRTGIAATVLVVSTGLFTIYYLDSRSALHRYVVTPILRNALDAETSHKLALKVLGSGLGARDKGKIWDEELESPVGLAAGFDKDGQAVDGLFDLGFSWVEIGSVTPMPQPGNPTPRVFRLPSADAIINRYGFPSQGHAAVLTRLHSRLTAHSIDFVPVPGPNRASLRNGKMLAVNLGKNKDKSADDIQDFIDGVRKFGEVADVLVVNVSSPNTPGLRGLQNKDTLEKLLLGVTQARDALPQSHLTHRKPRIVLKIAPDLDETRLIEMGEVIRNSKIDGVIVSNTTVRRPKGLVDEAKSEAGGLSGPPLLPLSLLAVRTLRSQLPSSIPIIGCGGITSGKDALEYAKSGAAMVQIYTGLIYDGVGVCRRVKDEIAAELAKNGGRKWEDIVKDSVEKLSWREPLPEKKSGVQLLIEEAEEVKRLVEKFEKSKA